MMGVLGRAGSHRNSISQAGLLTPIHSTLAIMPSDLQLKALNGAHRLVLKLTGGKVGWKALGMPVLELTTTGRKSGQPRTVMLTSPLQEGSTVVVVGSRGGD